MKISGTSKVFSIHNFNDGAVSLRTSHYVGRDREKNPKYENLDLLISKKSLALNDRLASTIDSIESKLSTNKGVDVFIEAYDIGSRVVESKGNHYVNRSARLSTLLILETVSSNADRNDDDSPDVDEDGNPF